MTKLTHDDESYIAMARAARLPVADIAESLGVSVRTVSRVAKAYREGGGRPFPKLTTSGTLERMSADYARTMVWVAYYERRIDQDPDNPRWHDCMLKWAQLGRGLLQDLAQYRNIDAWEQGRIISTFTVDDTEEARESQRRAREAELEEEYRCSFDRGLEDLAAALSASEDGPVYVEDEGPRGRFTGRAALHPHGVNPS